MDTPTSGFVLTSVVCLQCPILISDRWFLIDLVVLPLSQIDVILGMDWLSSNHVSLNCFEKSVVFLESDVSERDMSLFANQVEASFREDAQVYMILASMSAETKTLVSDIPLVRNFLEVFEEVFGLPPEKEVKFSVNLVPDTGPISIAPYRMSAIELSELKKQLEELLEKHFVRPSVSP